MTIFIFLIVLAVLIFVHELGHFLAAKSVGMKVERFAIGFPPKVYSVQKGETRYELNAIPFGGFVSILGENPSEDQEKAERDPDYNRSFHKKSAWAQAWVLFAGVFFNVLFAWILLSFVFMAGIPQSADNFTGREVTDPKLVITQVMKETPAARAGLEPFDEITYLATEGRLITGPSISEFVDFVSSREGENLVVGYRRGDQEFETTMVPVVGVIPEADQAAVGVSIDMVGVLKLPPHLALYHGAGATINLTVAISQGLYTFFSNIFTGQADFSDVAGPVGIVGLIGQEAERGFVYLTFFTALISINLALINLIPFPALDGGRLLFVLIEVIKGSPIKPKVANLANVIGFSLLILLMLIITFNDVLRFF